MKCDNYIHPKFSSTKSRSSTGFKAMVMNKYKSKWSWKLFHESWNRLKHEGNLSHQARCKNWVLIFWHICCYVIDKIKNVKFRLWCHCINVNSNQVLNIDLNMQWTALKENWIMSLAKAPNIEKLKLKDAALQWYNTDN